MESRPAMATFASKYQPLTPVSPLLPTTLPHVSEPIPRLPMTPPDADEVLDTASNAAALRTALHVIATERDGLTHLGELYQSSSIAQEGFMNAVTMVSRTISRGGKVVVCGVGKSGKIGEKVVATMNSFGICSTSLHPTEALHGDLGMIGVHDTILLLTFSGRTTELLSLMPHLRSSLPLIVITSHMHPSTCPLFDNRPVSNCILLPAPIRVSETASFGLAAPTTSTTVALALSDALALAVARRLHSSPKEIFHVYHPGGTIGANAVQRGPKRMGDVSIQVDNVPIAQASPFSVDVTSLDVILTAARSPSGWVRLPSCSIIAPRRVQELGHGDLQRSVHFPDKDVAVEKDDWISIPSSSTVEEAKKWIIEMRNGDRGRAFLKRGTIMGIVDERGEVSGVVEIEDIMGDAALAESS